MFPAIDIEHARDKMSISKLAEKSGTLAPDLIPYCLKHTYCTDLQDAGVPINVAKYLMGHSDISLTAKIYTHTTDLTIQDAAEKINLSHSKKEQKERKEESPGT